MSTLFSDAPTNGTLVSEVQEERSLDMDLQAIYESLAKREPEKFDAVVHPEHLYSEDGKLVVGLKQDERFTINLFNGLTNRMEKTGYGKDSVIPVAIDLYLIEQNAIEEVLEKI